MKAYKLLNVQTFILLLFSCFELMSASSSAKILIFGDFGTGTEDQALVAKDMEKFCQDKSCDFAITTGDNIYPRGIENLTNGKADYDKGQPNYKIATDVFVKNYRNLKIPFYMTYGNHDIGNEGPLSIFKNLFKSTKYLQKKTIALMNNQIRYTNHADNPSVVDGLGRSSRLWFFPDDYYHIDEKGNVDLYSINTNTYPHRALNQTNDTINENDNNFLQQNWLKATLKTNPSGWKMVFGHMPLYSHGSHAWLEGFRIKNFRNSIIDELCENKVDFYIAGHDHHLEVDKHECSNGHLLIAILSGAGAKRDRIYKKAFSLFSTDKNLLWGNGRFYTGAKSIFTSDDNVLGFSFIDIIDGNNAKLMMKQTIGNSAERSNGCFGISKGKSITKIPCE